MCQQHKGKFGLLFFQKVQFNEEDVFNNDETLCLDHIEAANSRAKCVFGIPFVCLIILAVICTIISILGIVGAINDVDFDASLETVPDDIDFVTQNQAN